MAKVIVQNQDMNFEKEADFIMTISIAMHPHGKVEALNASTGKFHPEIMAHAIGNTIGKFLNQVSQENLGTRMTVWSKFAEGLMEYQK